MLEDKGVDVKEAGSMEVQCAIKPDQISIRSRSVAFNQLPWRKGVLAVDKSKNSLQVVAY